MTPSVAALLTDSQPRPPVTSLEEHRFFEAAMYTDPALLPVEMERIFRRTWQYVGDRTDLPDPGMVMVADVAGLSVLVVRDADHSLKAFHNVCPHRASPLRYEEAACLKHLVCPYHGWVFDFNGQLQGTPAQKRFPDGFCLEDFSLTSVRVEQWDGFIFVSLDAAVPPLTEFLSPIPEDLRGYRTPATTRLVRSQYLVQCNWKNFHDNTLCDYHVAIAHPYTLSPLQGPVRLYEHEFGKYVNLLYTPTPADWRSNHSPLEHLSDRVRHGFFTYGIFPNLHSFALPNGICGWIKIEPITVNTCRVKVDVYGIPEISPDPATIERDFNATTQEDIVLTEGVQRGYTSGAYTAGIANGLEARILHQQRLIRQYLHAA